MYGMEIPVTGFGLLAGVVHGDDRRVVQAGGGLGLAAEPGLEGRVGGQVGAQLLDRHGSPQPEVEGPTDLGHPAAAEQLAQLVAASDQLGLARHLVSPPSSQRDRPTTA